MSKPLSKKQQKELKSLAAKALSDTTPTQEELDTMVDKLNDMADAGDSARESMVDIAMANGVVVKPVDHAKRIRNGEWREVLQELGSIEYNRIRLLALK